MIVDKELLLKILDDMRSRVESGDSLEGFIQYVIPEDLEQHGLQAIEAVARYRTGNLQGQGGTRVIE